MRRLTGPVTTAVRFAAAASSVGNRSAAEIAQLAETLEELSAPGFEIGQRDGHKGLAPFLAYIIRTDLWNEKRKQRSANFHVAHPNISFL